MRDQLIPFLVAILIAQTITIASLIAAPDILFSRPQHYQQTQNDSGWRANKENPAANSMSPPVSIGKFLDDHNGAINAIATVAMAALTIALVIFNGSLVRLVVRQTEDARQVSERQAQETQEQIFVAKDNAESARNAANVAKATLIASQRAWIRIVDVNLDKDLYFSASGSGTSVSFKIANVGNSPAIKITPHVRLVVLNRSGPYPPQMQREMCAAIRKAKLGEGFTLFPNESFPRQDGFNPWSIGVSVGRREVEEGSAASGDGNHIAFSVIGCIDYTFPTDGDIHHQTGFMFELKMTNGNWVRAMEEGDIPRDSLILDDYRFGIGRHAD